MKLGLGLEDSSFVYCNYIFVQSPEAHHVTLLVSEVVRLAAAGRR